MHTTHIFGWHCGLRTGRPRVFGSTSPVEVLACTAKQRKLREGMCNGTWRRMPVRDRFERPIRTPCCRGNTVPIHGASQPRLPLGLLNQVMGLSPGDMQWLELAQSLPPAYGATMFTHMIYSWLRRQHQLPSIDFQLVATTAGGVAAGLPLQELLQWASRFDVAGELTRILEDAAWDSSTSYSYVAGPTGMHLTSQLDTLQPGDHKQEALGPRSALAALRREPPPSPPQCTGGGCHRLLHAQRSPTIVAGLRISRAGRRYYARKIGTPRPGAGVGIRGFVKQALHDFARQDRQRGHLLALDVPGVGASTPSTEADAPATTAASSTDEATTEWEPPSPTQYSIRNRNSPGRALTEERESWDVNCFWRAHLEPMPEWHARGQMGLEPRRLAFSPLSFSHTRAAQLIVSALRARAMRTRSQDVGGPSAAADADGPSTTEQLAGDVTTRAHDGAQGAGAVLPLVPPAAATFLFKCHFDPNDSIDGNLALTQRALRRIFHDEFIGDATWSAAHDTPQADQPAPNDEPDDYDEIRTLRSFSFMYEYVAGWTIGYNLSMAFKQFEQEYRGRFSSSHVAEIIGANNAYWAAKAAAQASPSDSDDYSDTTSSASDAEADVSDGDSPSLPPSADSSRRGGGGLQGGARGDGDNATLANVRFRKFTAGIHHPGLTVREGLCHGRTQDGQPHAYEVTFQDRPQRRVATDLRPELQVDSDRDFPDMSMPQIHEQWQIIGHPSLGGKDICPRCFYSCSEATCPVCGQSPTGDNSRPKTRSTSRMALAALDAASGGESTMQGSGRESVDDKASADGAEGVTPTATAEPRAAGKAGPWSPPRLKKHNFSEEKRRQLASLIKRHEKQLADLLPAAKRDHCRDVSAANSTSCHLDEAAILGKDGKLNALSKVILDLGAFRGVITVSELQELSRMAAVGSVLYQPYEHAERLSADTVGGDSPECIGQATIDMYISGRLFTINLLVLSKGNIFLLGNDFANARCCGVNIEESYATLKHCPDGEVCTRFRTPISTISDPAAQQVVSSWAAVAKQAEQAPVNGAETPTYFLYANTPKRMAKWSSSTVRLRLPESITAGANLLVERLTNDAPTRTIARVCEGFYKAKDGYINVEVINPALKDSTYISEMEPIAKVTVEPEHFLPEHYADMTLDELMDNLTFGETLTEEEKDRWRPSLAAHLKAFSQKRIGKLHGAQCDIPTPLIDAGKAAPPYAPPRKLSPEQYAAAKAEFDKLVAQGLLTPTSGNGYGTPIVMVKKPKGDGKGGVAWRMACDFRLINTLSTKINYPLPNPVEALNALGKANWFSALDQSSAFHQIPIAEKDKIKTTVSFPWGQYYYETMPFGLVGASSVFQRAIDAILSGIAWHPGATHRHFVLCYIDDILVYTAGSLDDHIRDVSEVLGRLGGSGAILKPSKCSFGMTEVEFLGHVVCGEGTKMQKAKVDALQDLLPPNVPITPADLKRLVQMSQYYSRYIDGFSHIVHAIHTALAEHARNGSGLHDRIAPLKVRASVEALKAALTSDQVLMRPDFAKPFQLAVDTAVSSGVGAELSQLDDNGVRRPVAFYSRAFAHDAEERRWSPTQAECAGVVEAVEHFRYYLLPNPHTTELVTDHASLKYLLTAKQLSDVLTRYAMRLSEFDIALKHQAGKLLIVPDALSRLVKPVGLAPAPPSRGRPRGTVWETLRAPPAATTTACLVLLDASGENILVQREDDGSFSLPSTTVKPREQLTAATSRIYEGLRHTSGIRMDPRTPLDQVYVGESVYILKCISPTDWRPSSQCTLMNSRHLSEVHVEPLLGVFMNAWRCARHNGELPLPHPPSSPPPESEHSQLKEELAALTQRRPWPRSQEVGMAVIVTDEQGDKYVLIDKRSRPSSQGDAYSLPRERFPLPLAGDQQIWWKGRSSLAHAVDKLWTRVSGGLTHDAMYGEDAQLSWSWGSRGVQYVIVHLKKPRELKEVGHRKVLLPTAGSLWFAADKMFEKDLLGAVGVAIAMQASAFDLCAMLNCRTASRGHIQSVDNDEESAVTEAAEGRHPIIHLVRTAAAARQALSDIHEYFLTARRQDRVLALDIEGALRVGGWIGLLQVGVGTQAYVFDTVYADAIMALAAPPPTWDVPSLAVHLGDESIVKIVHSGSGDVAALYALYGICVRNVFDTCCADMLLRGARSPRGLGVVLEEWAGVARPEKNSFVHTDTIWRERPVSWHALKYAAEDVTHLATTYRAMQEAVERFDMHNCLQYHSRRMPTELETHVFLMPMQGDRLLVRDESEVGTSERKLTLLHTTVSDGQLRLPQPLDIQKAASATWRDIFKGPPGSKSDGIKCKHMGKAQRLGMAFIVQPAVTFDDSQELPAGLITIAVRELTSRHLADELGLSSIECAAVEWCKYTADRDADRLPYLPPTISLDLTARGVQPATTMDTAKTAFFACARVQTGGNDTSCADVRGISPPTNKVPNSGTLHAQEVGHAGKNSEEPPTSRGEAPQAKVTAPASSISSTSQTRLAVTEVTVGSSNTHTAPMPSMATPAPRISQQGCGEALPTLAALQPRADAATWAAVIVRDAGKALTMESYALERQPGERRTEASGWAFPRHRMHSGFRGSVVARQALEVVLGPFERLSAGGYDGMQRLVYLGRVSDTLYYEAYVHNLTENQVALFAAWRQRAATPSIAENWVGFGLTELSALKGKLSRSDDAMAAGMAWKDLHTETATAVTSGAKAGQLAHLGRKDHRPQLSVALKPVRISEGRIFTVSLLTADRDFKVVTTLGSAELEDVRGRRKRRDDVTLQPAPPSAVTAQQWKPRSQATEMLHYLAARESMVCRCEAMSAEASGFKQGLLAIEKVAEPILTPNSQQGSAEEAQLVVEATAAWVENRREEAKALHKRADELKSVMPAWAAGEALPDTPQALTAEETLLHAAASTAAKAAARAKLEPPTKAPPEDPMLGDDDNTNVARTRVPGWAPEITRVVLQQEQAADEYISVLMQLAAATGFVKREGAEGTFELVDGILYRLDYHGPQDATVRRQVVVPASLRGAFMRAYHDRMGHVGVKRVMALLRERAWWIGQRRDVRAYIRRCPTCAMTKLTRIQAGQARSLGNGEHPGDVWTYDILDIDSALRKKRKAELVASGKLLEAEALDSVYHPHKLLVFVDRFSRWVEAFPLEKDPTADEVTDIFVDEIVKRYGYPRAMTCDRGTNLMQGSVREYYEACGVRLVASDSHMHNTAGLVERFNGTLKDILKGFLQDVDEDADDVGARWWRYLSYALLCYNVSEATATGYSPFYLMYGRDARVPLHNTLLPPPAEQSLTYSEHVAQHLKLLYDAWDDARQQTATAAAVSRQQQNLSRDLNFKLKPGDRVLIRKPNFQGLEVPYSGPFRVAQVLDNDRVQLRDLHRVMHDKFHISRLKLYPYVDNDGNVAADREEYNIKDIKGHRQVDGETEYLVKWDGWDASHNSWEREAEFNEQAMDLVQAYWQRVSNDAQTEDGAFVSSTVEDKPISRAPALRSHREDQLAAAPTGFAADEQAAPEVAIARVDKARDKSKAAKLKKRQLQTQTTAFGAGKEQAETVDATRTSTTSTSPDVDAAPTATPPATLPSGNTRAAVNRRQATAASRESATNAVSTRTANGRAYADIYPMHGVCH